MQELIMLIVAAVFDSSYCLTWEKANQLKFNPVFLPQVTHSSTTDDIVIY